MGNTRIAAVAALPLIAGFMLAGCAGGTTAASAPTSGSAPSSSAPATSAPPPSSSSAQPVGHTVSTPTTTSTTPPATCQAQQLQFDSAQHSTGDAGITILSAVKNTGSTPCVIQGYPQVAITGLPPATGGWPHKQLTVTKVGPSYPVTLRPGDGAITQLTFAKCQTPTPGPVLLVGVPDGGLEMTMADGSDFTECGDTVQAYAFEAHLP